MSSTPPSSPWGPQVLPPTWTLSEWQQTTRSDPLVNWGRDDPIPDKVDIVVVGSGLAGAKTAHSLLTSYPAEARPSLITFEARETCSGASGRNAGHCRPDAFRGFTAFATMHGEKNAAGVLASEAITLDKVKAFVKEHSVECEFTERMTLDVVLSEEFKTYCSQAMQRAKDYGVDVSHIKYYEGEEAQKITRSPRALAAYEWPAASVNPAQLCYAIHRLNIALGAKLFSWTPVTSCISSSPTALDKGEESEDGYRWKIMTPRGQVLTKKVVWATNGYTNLVLPEMDGLITAHQAQAIKLTLPPAGMAKFPRIEHTMSLRYVERFYSVMQRPDNSIILASPRKWPGQSPKTFQYLFGTYDDTHPLSERTTNTFTEVCDTLPGGGYTVVKDGGAEGSAKEGEGGLDYAWSGILGVTPDHVPFVGSVPDREGQYIIAGFNGHGMARIFHVAPCLARLIKGEKWDASVPECFEITKERLRRLREGLVENAGAMGELTEKTGEVKV
ncbi:hypothetical protein B9479_000377 [Cryptococcus floricola]|uniref:FAD dependent oxidoreductase domain-containing protein n=1 Tax=Cryptococcus floricola TaxID=2591691 RepID=A0A5D3BA10_9TREE|nr:hypothetical protein B9479_000377 [Cryptococcus floricola]